MLRLGTGKLIIKIRTLAITIFVSSAVLRIFRSRLFCIWLLLEAGTFGFVLFLSITYGQGVKYLVIQGLFSYRLAISLCFSPELHPELAGFFLVFRALGKLGVFPFQSWFIRIFSCATWDTMFYLISFQKLLPLSLLSFRDVKYFWIIVVIIINSTLAIVFALGRISFLKRGLAFASLLNGGFMLLPLLRRTGEFLRSSYIFIFAYASRFLVFLGLRQWWTSPKRGLINMATPLNT